LLVLAGSSSSRAGRRRRAGRAQGEEVGREEVGGGKLRAQDEGRGVEQVGVAERARGEDVGEGEGGGGDGGKRAKVARRGGGEGVEGAGGGAGRGEGQEGGDGQGGERVGKALEDQLVVTVMKDETASSASCSGRRGRARETHRQDTERHGADKLEHRNAPRSHGCNRLSSRPMIRAGVERTGIEDGCRAVRVIGCRWQSSNTWLTSMPVGEQRRGRGPEPWRPGA
jgi:hypothetical protein